jgi:hypothetical protein
MLMSAVISRRFLAALVFVLAAYLGAYDHLSLRGDAWCRPLGLHGFLYVLPDDGKYWYEWHQFCRVAFVPANELDRALGGRLYPARAICGFGPSK